MLSRFKKKSICYTIIAFSLIFLVGCSSSSNSDKEDTSSTETQEDVPNSPSAPDKTTDSDSSTNTPPTTSDNSLNTQTPSATNPTNSQNDTLDNIKKLALQGKIINSEFPLKTSDISNIEEKLGKADKTDYVASAKGSYSTFSKYNVVFGFNKGSQVFEARSFDRSLKNITISMVKSIYGPPEYDLTTKGERIIGYTAGDEYKILLVFSAPSKINNDPVLDHYSVLYPKGTVNNMADDKGRDW